MTHHFILALQKETKGALVYREVDKTGQQPTSLGAVYVRKTTLPNKPRSISITLEEHEK